MNKDKLEAKYQESVTVFMNAKKQMERLQTVENIQNLERIAKRKYGNAYCEKLNDTFFKKN